ncbi:hypothetical protein Vpro01_03642 [Vibrio proteolyticus]
MLTGTDKMSITTPSLATRWTIFSLPLNTEEKQRQVTDVFFRIKRSRGHNQPLRPARDENAERKQGKISYFRAPDFGKLRQYAEKWGAPTCLI